MIASALPLLVIIAAILILALTHSLFVASPLVIAVQVAAVALNIWARRSFPPDAFRVSAAPGGSTVIRRGPYRFIRHPMYASALLFVWTAVVSHLSWLNVSIGVVVTAFAGARIVAEERLLRERFPEYVGYTGSTKAIIPFVI